MAEVIETYRAKTRLLVGKGYREVGEFVPEALGWKPTVVAVNERVGRLEKVFVSREVLDACMQKVAEREAEPVDVELPEIPEVVTPVEGATPESEGDESETPVEEDIDDIGDPEPDDAADDKPKKKIVRR